ncbi:MAG: metallophosphoesterase [Clostridia bacterium]|nr:metallophosphoesterase [Clostridia bacterium]
MRSRRLGKHAKHKKLKIGLRIGIIICILFVLSWPFIEPYTLSVDTLALENTGIPEGMRPLRIVYLSDIHTASWPFYTQSRIPSLVKKINSLNPDLVLLGGDYAQDPESCEAFFRALPSIHANYGIYAVLGEKDRYPEDSTDEKDPTEALSRLRAAMVAKGVTPLINDVVSIRLADSTVVQVAGVDDYLNGQSALEEVALKCQRENFVIFMSHNPSVLSSIQSAQGGANTRNWYDLGLFGHTLGGQIAPLRSLLGLTSDVPEAYTHGTLVEGRATNIISNGIGTEKVPLRLFCQPQLHVITVRYPR